MKNEHVRGLAWLSALMLAGLTEACLSNPATSVSDDALTTEADDDTPEAEASGPADDDQDDPPPAADGGKGRGGRAGGSCESDAGNDTPD